MGKVVRKYGLSKLTLTSNETAVNRVKAKGLCVSCHSQPRDGYNTLRKRPFRTCAACRVRGQEAARRSEALDKAEVAEATGAVISEAQQPFCKVWNVRWASAEAEGQKGIDQKVSAFCAVWAHFPVFPARLAVQPWTRRCTTVTEPRGRWACCGWRGGAWRPCRVPAAPIHTPTGWAWRPRLWRGSTTPSRRCGARGVVQGRLRRGAGSALVFTAAHEGLQRGLVLL
jgi:hypothetical protein